jgi:membrane protease YdiL (CAAX protease family)
LLAEAEQATPSPPGGVAWGPRDIVLALVLALGAGFTLMAFILVPVAALVGSADDVAVVTAGLVVTVLFDAALFGSAVVFSVARYRCSWASLGLGPITMSQFWPGVGTAVLGQVIVASYAGLVQLLGPDVLLPDTNVPDELFEEWLVLPLAGVAMVLVAPLAEETFFRGFVFAGLRRFGLFWAALASGFLFSAAHVSLGGLIPLTLVGMLFAWSYSRTGSLWTTIYAHFFFNLVSFAALTAIVQSGGST